MITQHTHKKKDALLYHIYKISPSDTFSTRIQLRPVKALLDKKKYINTLIERHTHA